MDKINILIVEGEFPAACELEGRLKGLGYNVCGKVISGEKTLEFVAEFQPDLVMMDTALKGGIDAAEIIKDRWGIPVVFLTAYTDTELLERAEPTYPFGYIMRPFQDGDLKVAIQMALYAAKADSERKKVEEALRENEARYRTTLDNMLEGCQIIAFDWRYLYLNESAAKQNRRPNEELLGRKMTEMWPGFETTKVFAQLRRSMEERIVLQEEVEFVFPDGSSGWFEVRSQPAPEGIFIQHLNITESKKAEEALKRSEKLFRSLIQGSPHGIFVQTDYHFAYMNEAAYNLFGADSADQLLGQPVMKRIHPDYHGVVTDRIHYLYEENGPSPRLEEVYLRLDGTEFWVEVSAVPIEFQGKEGAMVFFQEITDRKGVEEALLESKKRLVEAQRIAKMGDFVWDVETGEVTWSEALFELLGYDQSEKIDYAKVNAEIHHPDDLERVTQWLNDCLSSGKKELVPNEYKLFRKNGEVIYVRTGGIIEREGGKAKKIFATVHDISESKKAESDRMEAEKEKETLQAQLAQAQKLEAIGTLAGGISHDFNNLLQIIYGYTQILLMDKAEDDPDHQNLMAIHGAGSRASELVKQLLLFSRKADSERKPIELNHEVERAQKVLQRTIPKMVDIEVHLGSRLWAVNADPVQIEQILLNLGTNAADAMPDGGELIIETENVRLDEEYVRKHLEAQAGRYVLLTVSDTGHGMDKEAMEKIFEPFFTTKEIGKGTGLGLASVYGIVKKHEGYINCYSEVGRGTTFKIYLPAIEKADADEVEDFIPKPPKGGTETILIVDDEEPIRGFASKALKRFGYSVLTASTGEEALEVYTGNTGEIDLVILDIGMPGMGGHQCLHELIQIDPEVKVLIASGYSINGQVKKSLKAGALGYVAKPYQLDNLLEKVRSTLDG